MCYRLAILILLAILPVMNVLAAPAPEPSAVLDVGPPPKDKTAEQHLKDQIKFKTDLDTLNTVFSYPEIRKLPSIASMEDARPWLAKNLRVTPEQGGRRLLRITFRAGKRDEQVIIINAFLRASLFWNDVHGTALKCNEEWIRVHEKNILELEQRIKSSGNSQEIASLQESIRNLSSIQIPACRAEVTRLKQYAVNRWAR